MKIRPVGAELFHAYERTTIMKLTNLMFVVPYILVTNVFILVQLNVQYSLFL
jgi:hypothetical protein